MGGGGGGWLGKATQSFGITAGAISKNIGAKKAAEASKQGSYESDQLIRDAAAEQQGLYRPYSEAGANALGQLTAMTNQPQTPFAYRDSSTFLNSYFNSPEYQTLNKQAQDQILRGASATGGLRSGGSNVGLANTAPTIGINALNRINQQDLQSYGVNQDVNNNLYNQRMGIAGLGYNAANQRANVAGNTGINMAKGAAFRAGTKADMYNQYYGNLGQMHEDLGAVWGS